MSQKKDCKESISEDEFLQCQSKEMNRQIQISSQRLCTWANQDGYRRYHQVLYLCDGLLDYPSRHSPWGQTPLKSAFHWCCKALWTFRTYQWCLTWWTYNNWSTVTRTPVKWVKSICRSTLTVSTITMKLVWIWKQFDFISLPWQY